MKVLPLIKHNTSEVPFCPRARTLAIGFNGEIFTTQ